MTQFQAILIIEPDKRKQAFIRGILESEFKLLFTPDPIKGLHIAKLQKPKLILCSLDTPKISCFLFASLIHECSITADIPILINIEEQSSQLTIHSFKQGIDGVINQEANSEEIIAQITNCIAIRIKLKQLYNNRKDGAVLYNVKNQTDRIVYNRIKKIVNSNIVNQNLDVNFICRHLGVSRNVLQQKIKKTTGKTLGKYITFMKLEKAKEMLLHTDLLIYEISEAIGFNSRQSFIKAFKKAYALTPSSYRKRNSVA